MHQRNGIADPGHTLQLRNESEQTLLCAAKMGNSCAYAELCRRNRDVVFRSALKITKNREDAEDVMQEALMKGFTHLNTFRGDSAFSTWLTRIAINTALMAMRKRWRHKELSHDDDLESGLPISFEIVDPSCNPEEFSLRNERLKAMHHAILRLPPAFRRIVQLQQIHDAPLEEIAGIAGLSLAATKSRLMRARQSLRKTLRVTLRARL